jgi:hypothetical protein
MSAFALAVFAGLLTTVVRFFWTTGFSLMGETPRFGALFFTLGLVAPIFVIAFGNHLMHRILDRIAKRTTPRGFWPGLMSWWSGLYSWGVLMLSAWLSIGIVAFVYPRASFAGYMNLFGLDSGLASVLSIPTIVFVVTAAFLFQFERRVRDRIAAGPDSTV